MDSPQDGEQYLVTGAAGFIGYHVARALLMRGKKVVGVDNMNPYYDVQIKRDRLLDLRTWSDFEFFELDIADRRSVFTLFEGHCFDYVIHLAAQAGVRYSLTNPQAYVDSNISGFLNVLEECRVARVRHLVFASSSSVYGANTKTPFCIKDRVDRPVSLYAVTKRTNELMAQTFAHLYGLRCTGLRFFTVYGPWGRPDMAYYQFTKAILDGTPINVFNNGQHIRDFTYIDDVVEAVLRITLSTPSADNSPGLGEGPSNGPLFRLYNVGNHTPIELIRFIEVLETIIGKKAVKNFLPEQLGDVHQTYADISELEREVGFRPKTTIENGLQQFVKWYLEYYRPTQERN